MDLILVYLKSLDWVSLNISKLSYTCKDTDGGNYPFIFGTCESNKDNIGHADSWVDYNYVTEYYCALDGGCTYSVVDCGVSKVCLAGYCQTMNI